MNSLKKQHLIIGALALALCQWQPSARAAAAPDKAADTFPDPVVATGKGFEVKRSEVDAEFVNYSASVAARGNTVQEDQRQLVRSNLLQHLIITKILALRASPDDKAKAKQLVDDGIEKARKMAPTPQAFDAEIKASGMTLDEVRQRAYTEQLCNRVLDRETTNGIVITDDAVKKFYDDNSSQFEVPEQVRVAHILISTLAPGDPSNPRQQPPPLPPEKKKEKEKLAHQVLEKARSGEDFAKLVLEFSDDPGSKNKGGEYKFPKGQMVAEFEAASFSLKTNQISDLVETQFGYHIIKCLEKYPAKHEKFPEVETKIHDYLVNREAEKALPAYLDKLKAQADVKVIGQTDPAAPAGTK